MIIILMSLASVGIIFIQLYWIKWFVNLNEKNFDDKVYMALNEVKNQINENAEEQLGSSSLFSENIKLDDKNKSFLHKKFDPVLSKSDNYNRNRIIYEISSISKMLNVQDLLLELQPAVVSVLLDNAFKDQGIELEYEYGVFNNESKDYFILNENYAVDFGDTEQATDLGMQRNLDKSEYKIQLFSTEYSSPGFLALYFINKRGFVWSSVLPWLVGSILFTSLILFCFSYVVFVIFRQKKVSEMKTDFINNMTHEFKTPIATISLASDSINNPIITKSPDKVLRFTNIIKQENQRMLAQVEKVLQMATIEKKDFELKISDVDLSSVIEQAVDHANLKLQGRGTVQVESKLEDQTIEADHTHLTSIVHNLLDNAIKYTPENAEIFVKAEIVRDNVRISVRDNGIGISLESKRYIFDKFFRVHTGNLHDVKGFGLGLSYVKAMVDAHRGRIKVDSELGKGSTFTVILPLKYKSN